ncbi:MAG TPA: ATP-binding protein [Planctomycetaceae bacterium]|jgi:PAS domain S-box-containing protein|nr:ATP-binding protein [Planctomycetaceae bacterium]
MGPSTGPVGTKLGSDLQGLAAAAHSVAGILETVDLPIVVVGRDCRLALFNRAATDALGLAPSDLGRLACDIEALANVKDCRNLCAQVIADDAPSRREIQVGDRRFLLRLAPYRSNTGQIEGAVLTFTNVTAFRASIEQAIYEREYTKAILNTVVEPLLVLDRDLRVQTANRAFYAMFGASRETTQGVPLRDLGNDDWKTSELWALLRAIVSDNTELQSLEIECDISPIGRRTLLLDARRLSRDGADSILLVFRDITERKRSEVALRRDQEIFKLVHSIGKIGHWEWNAQTDENKWSPEIEALYGLKPGTFAGTYEAWAKLLHPHDLAIAEADVRRALETGKYFSEFRVIWPDRSVHWLEARAIAFNDVHGKPERIVGVNMDITERKRVEESLKDADRRKDEFLATLAHELRNPLAPIRNAVEILRQAGDDTATIDTVHSMMERQLGHMVRLIDDLLDVARITSGKLRLRRERVELASVVLNAVEECRPLFKAQSHQFTLSMSSEPVILNADPTRLAQLFCNLLNNAAKYTEKGGHIWLTVERLEGEVSVSVRDTGIGIDAEHLPQIFEMFSQAAPALERSQGGLGVGLALVRGLVELHGGNIAARSSGRGAGSEFIVRLPVIDAPAQEARQEPGEPDEGFHSPFKHRILIVDDNTDAADSLAIILRRAGSEIQLAHDGLEAVQAAATFQPEVVLLDIGLPKLNGYEAAKLIRDQSGDRRVAIIAMTGWGQEEDKRRALDAGFDHHLTKPVEPAALRKLLALIGFA